MNFSELKNNKRLCTFWPCSGLFPLAFIGPRSLYAPRNRCLKAHIQQRPLESIWRVAAAGRFPLHTQHFHCRNSSKHLLHIDTSQLSQAGRSPFLTCSVQRAVCSVQCPGMALQSCPAVPTVAVHQAMFTAVRISARGFKANAVTLFVCLLAIKKTEGKLLFSPPPFTPAPPPPLSNKVSERASAPLAL